MAGPFPEIDFEHFVQAEATYDTEPDTVAAGDAFRCRTRFPFKRVMGRLDRDQDSDNTASVHTTQPGRESSTWEFSGALIPSGVTATPTAPDMGEFFRAWHGTQDVGAGHSTCTSGSTTTVIEGTAGAVTALGAAVGDWIGVVTTAGVEFRQILSIATDAMTLVTAVTSAPANGSAITGTVSYRLSRSTLVSLMSYSYLSGNNFRERVGGMATANMEVSLDLGSETPEAMVKFSGPGSRITTFADARPTPTTAGQPLVPLASYAWFGTNKHCVTSFSLKGDNGMQLRNNESCSMYPTGITRTKRYNVELEIEMLHTTGTVEGYFDNADLLTAYDVTVQVNNVVGKGFAFRLPKFVPDAESGVVDGEVSLKLSGRAYGNGTADTEVSCCFF